MKELLVAALLAISPVYAANHSQQAAHKTGVPKIYIVPPKNVGKVVNGTQVATFQGTSFNELVTGAILHDRVPVQLVTDPKDAYYVMHWALAHDNDNDDWVDASISLVNPSGTVVWADVISKVGIMGCAKAVAGDLKNALKHHRIGK